MWLVERGKSQSVNFDSFYCPCVDRSRLVVSFVTHHRPTWTAGAQLRAAVRQAARDRELQLNEYSFTGQFKADDAARFLFKEVGNGTAAIVTTLYGDAFLPPLLEAHMAGIPIYLVGGSSPDLYQSLLQSLPPLSPTVGQPAPATLLRVGIDESAAVATLVDMLLADGIQYLRCITTDIGDVTGRDRCHLIIRTFKAFGGNAFWHLRSSTMEDLLLFVQYMEVDMEEVPGESIAVVVMDAVTYSFLKTGLGTSWKANALLLTYETSVEAFNHIRAGDRVLALDPGYYSQGYLAVALAAAEVQVGQALKEDVRSRLVIYGTNGMGSKVSPLILAREKCRVALNPVCSQGSSASAAAAASAADCRCFDRAAVRFKVVSGLSSRLQETYTLWQGLKDAERDMPGTAFEWDLQSVTSIQDQLEDYESVRTSAWSGAITLDAVAAGDNSALAAAIRAVSLGGKLLYLAYTHPPAGNVSAPMDYLGARGFVGVHHFRSGRELGQLAAQLAMKHVLANNPAVNDSWAWEFMRGVAVGVMGENYTFPTGVWDWPVQRGFSPTNRTGPWALFVAPGTNMTVQMMNGLPPEQGPAFLTPLSARLSSDTPAPELLIMEALDYSVGPAALQLLWRMADTASARRPVRLAMQRCTAMEAMAMLQNGTLAGESLLVGCVDEQPYLAMYLVATIAGIEQQTGESFEPVGTHRLLRADQLPRNFSRRAFCEVSGMTRGVQPQRLGQFYPLCDRSLSCVVPALKGVPDAPVCSGHGTCEFSRVLDPTLGQCVCGSGYKGVYCEDRVDSGSSLARVLLLVFLCGGVGLLALAFVLFLAGRRLLAMNPRRRTRDLMMQSFIRKKEPPARNMPIAAVVTDIEGSTSLWEWNPEVMKRALQIHHHVLRTLLPRFHGYESDTEGDSFTLVFHCSADALGWAMEVQRQLLDPVPLLAAGRTHSVLLRGSNEDISSDWPQELLSFGTGKEVRAADGSLLYRGLRVRMGIHVGVPEDLILHPNGRLHYKGEVMELAKSIQDASASGGQVLMSMLAWQSLGTQAPNVVCHHMGLHELCDKSAELHLMQVMPESLLQRAPFRKLKSKQLRPSFFDAPASISQETARLPIVICFIYVGGAKSLRRTSGYRQSVDMMVEFVQGRLIAFEGYECEEKDGNFLLAFKSAANAVRFAEAVQRETMDLDWPPSLLEQDMAAEVLRPPQQSFDSPHEDVVVFRGLRLQIGMCMDVPTDCQPHKATGRAAYFGPIMNRAARIAATAACGQTLANDTLFEAAIREGCDGIVFQELGKFDLKGIKEPMRLLQVSSKPLGFRLFPRTLGLCKTLTQAAQFDLAIKDDKQFLDDQWISGSVRGGLPPGGEAVPEESGGVNGIPSAPVSLFHSYPPLKQDGFMARVRHFGSEDGALRQGIIPRVRHTIQDPLNSRIDSIQEHGYRFVDGEDPNEMCKEELVLLVEKYREENRRLKRMLSKNQRNSK
eukprot:jgi/Mesvir1/12110/Mv00375-RA.1